MESQLTCREFVDLLAEYLEGRLQEAQRARFNSHLARCPSCASYTRSYQDTLRLGRRVFSCPDETLPGDVPEELVRAVLELRPLDP